MSRLFTSVLLVLLVCATAHCAATTDDGDAPSVDLTAAPNAISGVSTGETTGGDALEKKPEGGTTQDYLKLELKTVIVTSY